ncbi:MAG: aminodeoxychorismate synthase component I [Pseudohongiellaceae bacterium]
MPALEVETLPYRRDSATWMQRLAALDDAAFLDSGLSRQPHARFDILTALPATILTLPAGDAPGPDIFADLQQALSALGPGADTLGDERLARLPFRGGAIGYLGYASRRDLVPLRRRAGTAEHPQPRLPDARFGVYQWALTVDHEQQRCTLFFLPECPATTRERVRAALHQTSADRIEIPSFELRSPFRASIEQDHYRRAFNRLKQWIEAGDCYQANLAQRFHAGYAGDPLQAYLRLRQTSHSPFSAYLEAASGEAVLSLSPERFLRVEESKVLTQPIKGTRRRGQTAEEDRQLADSLRHSAKDRAENLMIVDLLRNDLGSRCATGSVRVETLFELQSYTAVHHLVSSITGELREGDHALALLHACFPGGSITGAPKIRAMEIIDTLEPDHRSVYCGSVVRAGFDGNLDSSIAIRTLLCDSDHIYCWGGGGIVSDSDSELEYQETIDKISLLINTLESIQ